MSQEEQGVIFERISLSAEEWSQDLGIPIRVPSDSEQGYLIRLFENFPQLREMGRGSDMLAYSSPDLDFVIKFP